MSCEEEISHLERQIAKLQSHVTDQDSEILRLSRLTDLMAKELKKLENRLIDSGIDSPVDNDSSLHDSPPPHY